MFPGRGDKNIEDIRPGDNVLSYDESTATTAFKPVLSLLRGETTEWCHVYVNDKALPLTSTPGHKYYLPENYIYREFAENDEHIGYENLSLHWVSAKHLKSGDKLLLCDGNYGIVNKVEFIKLSEPELIYNIEVNNFHTYFVGDQGVCVHNVCRAESMQQAKIELSISDDTTLDGSSIIRMKAGVNGNLTMQKCIDTVTSGYEMIWGGDIDFSTRLQEDMIKYQVI